MPTRAHQCLFQLVVVMRSGLFRGFVAHPSESCRWVNLMRAIFPSVLWLLMRRLCAVAISMVALVSLIEGSSAPYSLSGRNRRGDEHEDAICNDHGR